MQLGVAKACKKLMCTRSFNVEERIYTYIFVEEGFNLIYSMIVYDKSI